MSNLFFSPTSGVPRKLRIGGARKPPEPIIFVHHKRVGGCPIKLLACKVSQPPTGPTGRTLLQDRGNKICPDVCMCHYGHLLFRWPSWILYNFAGQLEFCWPSWISVAILNIYGQLACKQNYDQSSSTSKTAPSTSKEQKIFQEGTAMAIYCTSFKWPRREISSLTR